MKFILQVAFWGIIIWFANSFFGLKGILGVSAFILFINIVTWDEQIKKTKKGEK